MALRTIAPSELATPNAGDSPRRFRVLPERISMYASRLGLRHFGPDLEIDSFRPLSRLDEAGQEDRRPLTYLSASRFAPLLEGRRGLAVVTTPELQSCVPADNGVLLTNVEPRNAFYSILSCALGLGLFESLETFISTSAKIARTASISENVYVSDDAEIGAGVVILPNTYVGPGVVVKPNAVIGGNGFEPTWGNERKVVTHAGGVWLATGVHVGSCNCVDKGLFGDFTTLGSYTLLDNLVQFAHSCRAGKFCSITACAEISGSVVLGDGVWLGPNSSISQGIHIAEHCYIGTGSVVVRDLAAYSLAYGSPAKFAAWVCECRNKISFDGGRSVCGACGKAYVLTSGKVQRA
jgi:UDP-3-O-[3-hydroxymyristoyl] glucosamine N-acyltransferase